MRNRFHLVERVGQGAIGTVWRGIDAQTSRFVAVKLLKTPSASATTLFLGEIEALAELRHPNIVGYVDHGLAESGEPYLAMEWLEGIDLQTHLKTHKLSNQEAMLLASQALGALAVAHGRGIVHRDLKPANIFLCGGKLEQIKLVDFGIAKRLLDPPKAGARLAVGTPLYMSPEQARGLPAIDGRSDIFSLGSVLYEALTGTAPFLGESSLAVLAKVCVDHPPSLRSLCPTVPHVFADQIGKMLAKTPAERPQDAQEILAVLSQLDAGVSKEVLGYSDSLSMDEQRVVVVLMATFASAAEHASPTAHDITDTREIDPAKNIVLPRSLLDSFAKIGASVNHLVDGTLLITCSGNNSAPQLVGKAAKCALALRRYRSDAATAISLGKTVVRQGLPWGKVLDEASNRLANAAAGEISVDEETAGLISRTCAIHFHAGKWLLIDDAYATPMPVSAHTNERMFIGRDRDLEHLVESFRKVCAAQCLSIVLHTADAGIGKSRLASEMLAQLRRHSAEKYSLWRAQSDSLQAASPLGFARQLAMGAFGMSDETPRKSRREFVTTFLSKGGPIDHATDAATYLAELVGASPSAESELILRTARMDPRFMAEQMSLAFGDAIRAAARVQPLLVLLDDLQWADPASIKLLNEAFHHAEDQRCFVLALARPEIEQRHPLVWEQRNLIRVTLSPLGEHESTLLIRHLLPSDHADAAPFILERADGNPFFMEELARALRRRGKTEIPDAVLGAVQARLDDLPAPGRRVLRAASVYGRQFDRSALPPLLGVDEELDVDHWLSFLVKEEILQEQGASVFRFWHDLTREATYQSLTDGDRVLGHRLAGRWLDAQGNTAPSVLLEHYSRAADAPRSSVLAEEAADQAYAAGDLQSAIAFAERGRTFAPAQLQAGRLFLVQARCYRWLGRMQEGWEPAQQAMRLLPPGTAAWFTAIECCAAVLGETINPPEVLELSVVAQDTEPHDDDALNARSTALAGIAGGLLDAGFLTEGRELLAEAQNAQNSLLRPETRNRILNVQGKLEKRLGRLGLAITTNERALSEAVRAGNELLQAESRNNLSALLLDAGLFAAANAYLGQSLSFAHRIRSPFFESLTLANIGLIHMIQGCTDEADHAFSAAAARIRGLGSIWIERALGLYRAHLAVLQEKPEEARPFVEDFLRDPQLVIPYRPYALAVASQIALLEDRIDDALALAEEGRRMMDDEGVLPEEGEMYLRLTLAQALVRSGAPEQARTVLAHAAAKLQTKASEMNDANLEVAFMDIPLHRNIHALLETLSPG